MSATYSPDDFQIIKTIKKNQFVSTLFVQNRKTGNFYMADQLSISMEDKTTLEYFLNLINKLVSFHFESIQFIAGFSLTNFEGISNPVLFYNYSQDQKVLYDFVHEYDQKSFTNQIIHIYEIIIGLSFLHHHSIIYGDLNPKNILIQQPSHILLSNVSYHKFFPLSLNSQTNPVIPESILNTEICYTKETDVYLLGKIISSILTRNNSERIASKPLFDSDVPIELVHLVTKCLNNDPALRPTIDEIFVLFEESIKLINQNEINQNNVNQFDKKQFSNFFLSNFQVPWSIYENLSVKDREQVRFSAFGNNSSKFYVTKCFLFGKNSFPKNLEIGIPFLDSLNSNNYPSSLFFTGRLYEEGIISPQFSQSIEKAIIFYEKSAKLKNIPAMSRLVEIYSQTKEKQPDAFKYCKIIADTGNLDAVNTLGTFYHEGIGIEKDNKVAADLFKSAAEKGNLRAALNYGIMCKFGIGVEKDLQEALIYMKLAASQDKQEATFQYACLIEQLVQVQENMNKKDVNNDQSSNEINMEKVRGLFQIAADNKHPEACRKFGEILLNENKINEARKYLISAATFGDLKAKELLDNDKHSGNDFNKVSGEKLNHAMKIKTAADSGDAIAMINYGLILENGNSGIEKDEKEAAKYYKMSADKGNTYGMLMYAKVLEAGKGVTKNFSLAKQYYEKSAEGGNSKAMNWISQQYNESDIKSLHFNRMAAEKGNPESLKKFVRIIKNSPSLEPNVQTQMMFYKKAADIGDPVGQLMYGSLLTKSAIEKLHDYGSDENTEKAAEHSKVKINKDMISEGLKYIKLSADSGNVEAMNAYAFVLSNEKYQCIDFKTALEYYLKAASFDDPAGLVNAGYWLQSGAEGIEIDLNESMRLFKRAADLGDAQGLYNYANALVNGDFGVEQDFEAAARLYRQAAETQNHHDSMVALGTLYENGRGVQRNYEEALKLYKTAANLQNVDAQAKFGILLAKTNPAKKQLAIKYIKRAAALNNCDALNIFGEFQMIGFGVKKDYQEAKKHFKAAEKLGSTLAICNLAKMAETGRGTLKSYEKARTLYERAINEEEEPTALYRVGLMKLNGHLYATDYDAAENYFLDAIEEEEVEDAFFALGWMYENGIKVDKNYEKAFELYQKGYKLNSILATIGLGHLYLLGRGVEKNEAHAKTIFDKVNEMTETEELVEFGLQFENGESAPQDDSYAALCYKIASDHQSQCGRENYQRLVDKQNL
ncbi:hypothetical protein TRFO_15152 [Tritrichomonas foetus]|uniref:Protein kinase domain-containing protein n=1 Tax=Tritrichomonas foetus TaxID=1144522 RepID=A0A1J4KTN7_9EUKA|nr:hypothetical protein TRFO_15152 [Tritrichomonas foetus]|eukprot:OHT14490.1 hypothetical protein TRFO_15152 [Tritrichomonas foetus]